MQTNQRERPDTIDNKATNTVFFASDPFPVGPYLLTHRVDDNSNQCVSVYDGTDTRTNAPVSVKLLLLPGEQHEAEQAEQTRRVDRDLRLFLTLTRPPRIQPHLLPLRDIGLFTSTPHGMAHYVVTEPMTGETLAERLARQGTLAPKEAGDYLLQIADALDALHGENVVHSAVRPENIFFAKGPHTQHTAKLMDWGTECPTDAANAARADELVRSAPYLSPEQTAGRPATAASDIWSLGVVLYEMLAGRAPLAGPHAADTLYRVAFGHAARIEGLGEMGDRVLARALERDPNLRYASAGEMAREFRAAVAALSVAGPAQSSKIELQPIPVISTFPTHIPLPPSGRTDQRFLWASVVAASVIVAGTVVLRSTLVRTDEGVGKSGSSISLPAPEETPLIPSTSPVVQSTRSAELSSIRAPKPTPGTVKTSGRPVVNAKTLPATPPLQTSALPRKPEVLSGFVLPSTPKPIASPIINESTLPSIQQRGKITSSSKTIPLPSVETLPATPQPPVVAQNEAMPPASPRLEAASKIEKPGEALPNSAEEPVQEGETLMFKGIWRGTYEGHSATLTVDKQDDEKGTFSGTVALKTDAGSVRLAITGHLQDSDGEPVIELSEARVWEQPASSRWRLTRSSGTLGASGEMSGSGAGRTWSFSR